VNNRASDPFERLKQHRESGWERLLRDEPDLMDEPERQAHKQIRGWHEIPDPLSFPASTIEWIVEGLIPQGSITLVAGEPGSYKSWLGLSLLRAVSTGGRFLNRTCKASNVLYLDRENPITVIRERLAMLGVESLDNARIWGGWLPSAAPTIGDARLCEMVQERQLVIIFDSLIRFHDVDENSATEMALVMKDLRHLANLGATIIILHHKSKGQGSHYRGSSDIAGGVDIAFSVCRDRNMGTLTLDCFKSRYFEELKITLRPDLSETGDFAAVESPDDTSLSAEISLLEEFIRANVGTMQGEIVSRAGLPKAKTRSLLTRFEGQRWRIERGLHNAKRYYPI
jgi:predicted ATP-dependent serine protease